MSKSVDNTKFELRIPPTATEDVAIGTYILVVEVASATLIYKDEIIQEQLELKPQGIKG